MTVISHLVAVAKNRVIGVNNDLPWSLPEDLKHFKEYTLDKPIVMGRKTFESIGRPLPKRLNIVISQSIPKIKGAHVFTNVDEAIQFASNYNKNKNFKDEVIAIGGAQIFNETIMQMKKLVLTKVDCEIDGDVYYPEINLNNFSKRNIAYHPKNEENQFDFSIDIYEKN